MTKIILCVKGLFRMPLYKHEEIYKMSNADYKLFRNDGSVLIRNKSAKWHCGRHTPIYKK